MVKIEDSTVIPEQAKVLSVHEKAIRILRNGLLGVAVYGEKDSQDRANAALKKAEKPLSGGGGDIDEYDLYIGKIDKEMGWQHLTGGVDVWVCKVIYRTGLAPVTTVTIGKREEALIYMGWSMLREADLKPKIFRSVVELNSQQAHDIYHGKEG